MSKIQRNTDSNNAGGSVSSPNQNTVYANNLKVSNNGSTGTSDVLCGDNNVHCGGNWGTSSGCETVFVEHIPTNRAGDVDTCGHIRVGGSPNVFICAGTGGGALIDNNPPLAPAGGLLTALDLTNLTNIGGNPSPPPGYDGNTTADIYSYHNMDDAVDNNDPIPQPPDGTVYKDTKTIETDDDAPANVIPPSFNCNSISSLDDDFNWSVDTAYTSFSDFAENFQLSPHYTLKDLCYTAVSHYSFSSNINQNMGQSQKLIMSNLCIVANTILEPLFTEYGSTFTITSGWRKKSGGSQHNKGLAIDIQFLGYHGNSNTRTTYYNTAKHIRDSIAYKTIILEYFGRTPWIHLDMRTNRGKTVLTQVAPNSYAPGLSLISM